MITVYGAAGSGKSKAAENIITGLAKEGKLFYLATMENKSEAAKERINRHKKLREGKGFITIEEPFDLSRCVDQIKGGYVLIEDVSNLLANIYFSEKKTKIIEQFELINTIAKEVVVVANNIFEEGPTEDEMCDGYLKVLAALNSDIANMSDTFVEVICGQVIVRKGEKTWQ